MTAYYNENDPYAAQWLRNLIARGLIAPGDVDDRDIHDVRPDDLVGYDQCHWFAGIAGWSLALRMAGWPDDRQVWTGSCPCQPFSTAGKGKGFDDERHLWPAWFWLIDQCRPDTIFGEQVASPAGRAWLDLVFSDLEAIGYACGAVVFPAAGVGAPQQRHRTYWVARSSSSSSRLERAESVGLWNDVNAQLTDQSGFSGLSGTDSGGWPAGWLASEAVGCGRAALASGGAGELAGSLRTEWRSIDVDRKDGRDGQDVGRAETHSELRARGEICVGALGSSSSTGLAVGSIAAQLGRPLRVEGSAFGTPGPLRGVWQRCDWIWHRDGKYRPVEPESFPLDYGHPGRVGKLRAYGNAIVPQAAAEFISAYLDAVGRDFLREEQA